MKLITLKLSFLMALILSSCGSDQLLKITAVIISS